MKTKNPKLNYKIRNWNQYNKALTNRGSLTLWIDEELVKQWRASSSDITKARKPGRPITYHDDLILAIGTLREVYGLPFRQTVGFMQSILKLMSLDICLPDYSTLCRRLSGLDIPYSNRQFNPNTPAILIVDSTGDKVSGEGEWKVRLHGKTKTRIWRKIHIAQDLASWEVVGVTVTDAPAKDHQQVDQLLSQMPSNYNFTEFIADGAYDCSSVYKEIRDYGGRATIPPKHCSKAHHEIASLHDRNEAIGYIDRFGRQAWKQKYKYHRRSLVETTMWRYNAIFGNKLTSQTDRTQETQVKLRIRILNRFTQLGMPDGYMSALCD